MKKPSIRMIAVALILNIGVYSGSFAQSQELQLLAHVDSYGGYNDCWGYTAPDGREYALLGARSGTSIIDITDPANAYEVDFISSVFSTWKDIKTYQHYAYAVTEAGGGLQIFDLSNLPNSVTELPAYSGFSTSHNIYIDVDNAMLYAEGDPSEPVRTISLADPENPGQISSFGIECHDIYARNNIVYVSEGGSHSIGVYDLSTPTMPSLLTRISVPNSGYVHNAWLSEDGNYLMSTEETGGKTVKYWNIQNLGNPTITDTYLGGSSLAHNAHIKGDYAYISHYESGLKVVDISNPDSIFEVGYYDTYPQGETPNFNGAWGAFPFFNSGKVLISDMQTGLYVVYFAGAVTADPIMNVSPTVISDTLLVGESNNRQIIVSNNQVTPSSLSYALTENPSVSWLNVMPNSGTLTSGQSDQLNASLDAAGLSPGSYSTQIVVSGNDPNNAQQNIAVNLEVVQVTDIGNQNGLPETFALNPNYPNPFNPITTISYQVPRQSEVRIEIYTTLGQKVRTLLNDQKEPGAYEAIWNGRSDGGAQVSSGVYLYRMIAGNFVQTRKMVLMK